jgi:hypothetical protein
VDASADDFYNKRPVSLQRPGALNSLVFAGTNKIFNNSPKVDINNLLAEDLIINDVELSFYQKGMKFFYGELVHLNVNIFILDHILGFPFHLFTDPDGSLFFRMVFENFFYASLLIVTRITTDQKGDLFTLPRFRNHIRAVIKNEYQQQFNERLKQTKFDKNSRELLDKIRELRNIRVVHVKEDIAIRQKLPPNIAYSNLKTIRGNLNDLLGALSFNVEHFMLPIQYHPEVQHPPGYDSRPDIEIILDNIAKNSPLLNLPEKSPQAWKYRKDMLPETDLELLNKYRRKFKMVSL